MRNGSVLPVVLALLTLYLVWGSTYLAIRFVVEADLPLLWTAAVRFAIAGALMVGGAVARGTARPTRAELGNAFVAGVLMFVGSNGLVMAGQTRIASGLAAVLVALTPVWIALFDAARGERPGPMRALGVVLGLVGVGVLLDPRGSTVDPLGAGAVIGASLCWSTGTMWSRLRPMPTDPVLSAGLQMAMASVVLAPAGFALGERWPDHVPASGLLGFVWLLVGGSIVGYGSYTWLLKVTKPAIATTYAYVNPLVAVILGFFLAGEQLSPRSVVAGAAILAGVAAITLDRPRRRPAALSGAVEQAPLDP
ncbi:MAG: EamA family transporter [Alphaproteobacteria bacterium]|nr:EamA family transporter [Alphaproteobacteria bacterium]MCB9698095.1 EamA family transporter [Alphaproteobacteria bacterium]